MPSIYPFIPNQITVHLGPPSSDAENVTVPFTEYIKNVASSELYPSWPEAALRANIYAIITFALNRVYTEWYRSRGYDFDITNSTQYDQAFTPGRDVFENISQIVDEIFNNYVVRQGSIEPYFTQFCNGTTVTCEGLSQWGTVPLAEDGYSPYQILQYYYGDDINIVQNAPLGNGMESYPGRPLRLGSGGNDVYILQNELNRISDNYPAIPKISPADGIFRQSTEQAVRKFQEIFSLEPDGIVGKATWYKIKRYYTAVKGLGELSSEGISLEEATPPFDQIVRLGSRGEAVRVVQYYLNVIAYFNDALDLITIDGIFGPATEQAVRAFQQYYGLTPDGIVGRNTWNKMQDVYLGIVQSIPSSFYQNRAKIYPGYILSQGQESQDVRDLQTYLALIGRTYTALPEIPVTGYFGTQTDDAVRAFQKAFGLPQTGSVGAVTWDAIANEYNQLTLSGLTA